MYRNGVYLLALVSSTALTLYFAYFLWRATVVHEGNPVRYLLFTGFGIFITVRIIQAMMKPRPLE